MEITTLVVLSTVLWLFLLQISSLAITYFKCRNNANNPLSDKELPPTAARSPQERVTFVAQRLYGHLIQTSALQKRPELITELQNWTNFDRLLELALYEESL
jgi:hypothetical protein